MEKTVIKSLEMSFPNLLKSEQFDGYTHRIEATNIYGVYAGNSDVTDLFILSYHDLFVDPEKKKTYHTLLRDDGKTFYKVTLLDTKHFQKLVADGFITLAEGNLECALENIKSITFDEPVEDIDALLDLSKIADEPVPKRHVLIVHLATEKLIGIEIKEDGTVENLGIIDNPFDLLTEGVQITWRFRDANQNIWKPTLDEIHAVISEYNSDSKDKSKGKDDIMDEMISNPGAIELFVDSKGKIYKKVNIIGNKVDMSNPGETIAQKDIDKLDEEISYFSFDENGTIHTVGKSYKQAVYKALFLGPDGRVYTHLPLIGSKIDMTSLPEPLDNETLTNYLKFQLLCFNRFDSNGNIEEVRDEVINCLFSTVENSMAPIEEPVVSEDLPIPENENNVSPLLYIGPGGKIYKTVLFAGDRIDVAYLSSPIDDLELVSTLKYSNPIWVKFDSYGIVAPAEPEDINPIIEKYDRNYSLNLRQGNYFSQI